MSNLRLLYQTITNRLVFKSIIKFFIYYLLFWLILFNLTRALFLLYYSSQIADVSLMHIFSMPRHAFMLDLSMICYILAPPMLLIVLQQFFEINFALRAIKYYSLLIALIYVMITAAEINLFAEWQTKIDYRAIVYLSQPSEVFQTATYTQTIIFFAYVCLIIYVLYRLYAFLLNNAILSNGKNNIRQQLISSLAILVCGAALISLGIRGGWQQIPINQSWAYYSKNNTINQASVNALWNLLGSLYQNSASMDSNPYI